MTRPNQIFAAPIFAALILAPLPLYAAGGMDSSPPPATPTSTECASGTVWDADKGVCVDAQQSGLNDDALFDAARELAYAGRYDDAIHVASAMEDAEGDRALTILGFAHRKAGRVDLGMSLYAQAIAKNPDNLLVRSYKGQAHVEAGNLQLARAELAQIEARGGAKTWPAEALVAAIQTGVGFTY